MRSTWNGVKLNITRGSIYEMIVVHLETGLKIVIDYDPCEELWMLELEDDNESLKVRAEISDDDMVVIQGQMERVRKENV